MYKTRILSEPELASPKIKVARFDRVRLERTSVLLLRLGLPVFSLAIIGLGIETLVCAHRVIFLYPQESNPRFPVIPVLPFLPPVPWLAYLFGAVLVLCGVWLLSKRAMRMSSTILGTLLFLSTLVLELPKYSAMPGNMSLRTVVFEPFVIAALAWLLPGAHAIPPFLERASRYLLAVCFRRVWCGSLSRSRADRNVATEMDSLARVLDSVVWCWIHSCWVECRPQYSAALGRKLCWLDVRDLGFYTSSSSGSWPVRHPGGAAQSCGVVQPIHCHRTVGRFVGTGEITFQGFHRPCSTPILMKAISRSESFILQARRTADIHSRIEPNDQVLGGPKEGDSDLGLCFFRAKHLSGADTRWLSGSNSLIGFSQVRR